MVLSGGFHRALMDFHGAFRDSRGAFHSAFMDSRGAVMDTHGTFMALS